MEEIEHVVQAGDGNISLIETPSALIDTAGTALVVPPFAMQARDVFPVAMTLSRHGFDVWRLDGRDSLGLGSGRMRDYKLSTVTEDMMLGLRHIATRDGTFGPVLTVGLSLSARCVVRALCSTDTCDGAVLLTPVVDVRATLVEVLECDLFALPEVSRPKDVKVLGQWVSTRFVEDARSHGYEDLKGTLEDLGSTKVPLSLVYGDKDPWVAPEAVLKAAQATAGRTETVVVQAASHELNRNPTVAMTYVERLTEECLRIAGVAEVAVTVPTFAELIAELGASEQPGRREKTLQSLREQTDVA